MDTPTNIQTLHGPDGTPAFVVIPYADYLEMFGKPAENTIPHAVVTAAVEGATPMRAWREHLRLTQAEVAERMGITQGAYAQMESATRPRKATLERVAAAFGIHLDQLDF